MLILNIVRLHKNIKDELRWRTGVVLEDLSMGATAVVKSDQRERLITIEVGGEQKRDYFSVIRKAIRDINASFEKLETTEMVPLPDNDDIKVKYQELIGHELENRKDIFIGELRRSYSESQLLDGIESKEERMNERNQKEDHVIHFEPKIEVNPHIEVKPENKQTVNVTTTTTQSNQQSQKFNIAVDLPEIQEAIEELKDILLEQNPSLERRFRELGDSWDGLREDGEKEKFTAPMNKMKRLVKEINDEGSGIRNILSKTRKGIETAQKVARTYNKFAQWLALPLVPDVLLGKNN